MVFVFMKSKIVDIKPGDLIYSKRSKRLATVLFVSDYGGFTLKWNKPRFMGDELTDNHLWSDWYGKIPEEYLIFDTEHEKLAAKLKYSS